MPVRAPLLSGRISPSAVPAGSLAKAALVGANTVYGPAPERVLSRPAALTALTRMVWSAEVDAFSTIVLLGYIGAPPTVTGAPPLAEAEPAVVEAFWLA